MLGVYAFVFTAVLKAQWTQSGPRSEFVMILYAGLIVFNFFAECVNRAPSLVIANVNYVKKVVFPLEVLPIVTLGAAAFQLAINLIVWFIFHLVWIGIPSATILCLPIVLLPLVAMTAGVSWFLASLGVFLRDVNQVIGIAITVLMYLSPVFYPLSTLPPQFRPFMLLSPLTLVVEQARGVMLWATLPDWTAWFVYFLISILVASLGFNWFRLTKRGFADVL